MSSETSKHSDRTRPNDMSCRSVCHRGLPVVNPDREVIGCGTRDGDKVSPVPVVCGCGGLLVARCRRINKGVGQDPTVIGQIIRERFCPSDSLSLCKF
uniref:Uncharacterized protein n=1 Tax=uncultured marine virus TaxID=186617 RepID=A0A0F7L5S9_9VIRU|nr:hypothetical protein [uncultured marine virus]